YTVYAEMGAKSRGELPPAQRDGKHFLVLDECQNYIARSGEALEHMLVECRKYGLFTVLAHQHWGQIPPEVRGALSQAGIDIAFHLELDDAQVSAPRLRFPYDPYWYKPTPVSIFAPTAANPLSFYSRSEQERLHVEAITALRRQEAFIRMPDSQLYQMRALSVPDPVVDEHAVTEIEEAYLAKYFRPQAAIEADIAATLRTYGVEDLHQREEDNPETSPDETGEPSATTNDDDDEDDDYAYLRD
ncbi:MAG: type IV secretory system conjugative DNA transfer family protein, partial [Chloroflexota bacterium]|nr:type IV secretory system conjugative DNA transfer family protein [Chloroflexota bacterium]